MASSNHEMAFTRFPDYRKEAKLCSEFLNNFEDLSIPQDLIHGRKKYLVHLVRHSNPSKNQ